MLGRGAGLLPEPKYTFYNQCTESQYLSAPYPYHNCDHITSNTMLFHTIFLYTGLWQERGAGKRCRALARAHIYIYIYMIGSQ